MSVNTDGAAVVLGLFETGLGVTRSLGRAGIRVLGFDWRRQPAFRSRYVTAALCPHPAEQERAFVRFLAHVGSQQSGRPALLISADEFVLPVARHRSELEQFFRLNESPVDLLESISDKLAQQRLAEGAGIAVPVTIAARNHEELAQQEDQLILPAFVKGREVNSWRSRLGHIKGFLARNRDELHSAFDRVFQEGLSGLAQEVIPGPDTNLFMVCCYVSRVGEVKLAFCLRKIRQLPRHYGFGCAVRSVHRADVMELGLRLFRSIGYRGVGAAEFKLDERDGRFKLIELNPRYWQQNALADRCGMNFPLTHYLDVTGQQPAAASAFREGVLWVNIHRDFESYREYRAEEGLRLGTWLRSLRGPRVFSDHALDDPMPGLCQSASENLWRRGWRFLANHLTGRPAPVVTAPSG